MRLFVSGSAPLLVDTFEAWRERTGHTILERYGMSETVMLTSNPYRPSRPGAPGTVGRALPGVGCACAANKGALRAGEIGGIEVVGRASSPATGRCPRRRARSSPRRLVQDGDVGTLDAGGVLTIVGRSKDLIITGGFNVYPGRDRGPHQRARRRGGVGRRRRAASGFRRGRGRRRRPAPRERRLEPAAVTQALKDSIAGFKVPKHVRVVDALPRNAMGKVQKKLLREELAGLFA
jgi:malonyl-CoA/methylmalonyl-CoA synthetase